MADNLKNWILLKNAAGQAIYPQIDLRNVREGQLLAQANVDGLVAALADRYTKEEVNSLVDATNFEYTVINELPEASVDTMYRIYFVARPETDKGKTGDVYDEYITLRSGEEGSYTYAWEKIGDTAIDLSSKADKATTLAGYGITDAYTKGEVDGELAKKLDASAIAAYSTTEQMNTAIGEAKAAITGDSTKTIAAIDSAKAEQSFVEEELAKKVAKTDTVNGVTVFDGKSNLTGNDITLGAYNVEDSTLGFAAATKITDAFKAIDDQFANIVGGGEGGDDVNLTGINVRLTEAESDIEALESVTEGYTAKGEIKTAVDAKAEKTYVDEIKGDLETAINGKVAQGDFNTLAGRVDTAEGEIDVLQGALEGLLSAGAVKAALDLKANAADVYTKDAADDLFDLKADKADVDAVIGAKGSLTEAVAANTAAVATKAEQSFVEEELAKKANSADLAMVVYYEVISED